MLIYEPLPGEHIGDACSRAVRMANRENAAVQFTFNEVRLVATPDKSPGDLEQDWTTETNRRRDEWMRSPEYKRQQERDRAEVAQTQMLVDELIENLPQATTLDAMICWLRGFTNASDRVGVRFDKSRLADDLERMGYRENEHVGQPQEWFDDREKMGRYLVGQAINCLRKGMPPHPVMAGFADEYAKLAV